MQVKSVIRWLFVFIRHELNRHVFITHILLLKFRDLRLLTTSSSSSRDVLLASDIDLAGYHETVFWTVNNLIHISMSNGRLVSLIMHFFPLLPLLIVSDLLTLPLCLLIFDVFIFIIAIVIIIVSPCCHETSRLC